jgi:hypothetical protein
MAQDLKDGAEQLELWFTGGIVTYSMYVYSAQTLCIMLFMQGLGVLMAAIRILTLLNTMSYCAGTGCPDGGHPDINPKYNVLLCRDWVS